MLLHSRWRDPLFLQCEPGPPDRLLHPELHADWRGRAVQKLRRRFELQCRAVLLGGSVQVHPAMRKRAERQLPVRSRPDTVLRKHILRLRIVQLPPELRLGEHFVLQLPDTYVLLVMLLHGQQQFLHQQMLLGCIFMRCIAPVQRLIGKNIFHQAINGRIAGSLLALKKKK